MNSSFLKVPAVLGLTHCLADCISGITLGGLPDHFDLGTTGALILLYNILAFAGQLPAGIIIDKLGNPRAALFSSLILIASGLVIFGESPVVAVVLLGAGSGIFHVAGGMISLMVAGEKASGPGLFAAPGVIGLAIGGYLAINGIHGQWVLLTALIAIALLLYFLQLPNRAMSRGNGPMAPSSAKAEYDSHDMLMVLLLAAIAMRSAIWNIFQAMHHGDFSLLIPLAIAAFVGKALGGFAADKWGWKRFTVVALLTASALLTFADGRLYLLLPGVALLQSATPVAIAAMYRLMPKQPGTAAGLSLGLALAFGGIPFFMGLSSSLMHSSLIAAQVAATALLFYFVLKRIKPTFS